jgi:peptidoglycan-N-acetylglucosamine deacetylase
MLAVLSFDIEDWFHILDNASTRSEAEWSAFAPRIDGNVDRILDLLAGTGQKATFFTLGWMARRHPQVVRRIADAGHEIACHSDMHQLVYDLGPGRFRADLATGISSLEDAVGQKITAFRAPGFSVRSSEARWFFEALVEAGIEIDCSIFVGRHGHGGMSNFPASGPCRVTANGGIIKELPMCAANIAGRPVVFSGGGYFRLLPYAVIRRLAAKQPYLMTYFHPRDFDPEQPVVPGLSPLRRFKSYYGLDTSLAKLRQFLCEFAFTDVRDAAAAVKWERVPEVHIS